MQIDNQSQLIPVRATQQINNSSNSFQELVNSLRKQQRKYSRDSISQFNPQSKKSINTNQCYSDKQTQNQNSIISGLGYKRFSEQQRQEQQDDIIKPKPKGNIAGRDTIQKKKAIQLLLPKHSFDQKLIELKQDTKNKIVKPPENIMKNQQIVKASNINMKVKELEINASLASFGQKQSYKNQIQKQFKTQQRFNTTFTHGMPLISSPSPPFPQNKFNKLLATSKKIKDIDYKNIKQFLQIQAQPLCQTSQLKQIVSFFNKLCEKMSIHLDNPLIKKYRNCIYFGQQIDFEDHYQGFLYFHDGRFYFGELINGKKWGQGTEININQQTMSRGYFSEGHKTGKFEVKKPQQHFIGYLQNGLYHGQGKLVTKNSVYTGQFVKGQKHGLGQEIFPKTGLKMTGYYCHGVFDSQENNKKRSFSHSKPQLVSHNKAKPNTSFQKFGSKSKIKFRNDSSKHFRPSGQIDIRSIRHKNDLYYEQDDLITNKNMHQAKKRLFNPDKLIKLTPMYQKYPQRCPERFPLQDRNRSKNNKELYSRGIYHSKNKLLKGIQQYDYSFDMSSRKNTESLFGHTQFQHRSFRNNNSTLSKNDQLNDTNQFEEPLPVPSFPISRR